MPETIDLTLERYRGDTIEFDVFVVKGGLPLDIAAVDLWSTFKQNANDSDAGAIQKTNIAGVASGITKTDAANGAARVRLAPDDTSGIVIPAEKESVTLEGDVQIKEADADTYTVGRVRIVLYRDITRAT